MYSTCIHNKATAPAISTEIPKNPNGTESAINGPNPGANATGKAEIRHFPRRYIPRPDLPDQANILLSAISQAQLTRGEYAGYCLIATPQTKAEEARRAAKRGGRPKRRRIGFDLNGKSLGWGRAKLYRWFRYLYDGDLLEQYRTSRGEGDHGAAIRLTAKAYERAVNETQLHAKESHRRDSIAPPSPRARKNSYSPSPVPSETETERESLSANNGSRKLQGSHEPPPPEDSRPSLSIDENQGEGRGEEGEKAASKVGNKPVTSIEANGTPRQRSSTGPEAIEAEVMSTPEAIEAQLVSIIEEHRGEVDPRQRQDRILKIGYRIDRDGYSEADCIDAVYGAVAYSDGWILTDAPTGLDPVIHALGKSIQRYIAATVEHREAAQAEAEERERSSRIFKAQHCRERWREVKREADEATAKAECQEHGHRWAWSHWMESRGKFFVGCERCRYTEYRDDDPYRDQELEDTAATDDTDDPFSTVPPTVEDRRRVMLEGLAKVREQQSDPFSIETPPAKPKQSQEERIAFLHAQAAQLLAEEGESLPGGPGSDNGTYGKPPPGEGESGKDDNVTLATHQSTDDAGESSGLEVVHYAQGR